MSRRDLALHRHAHPVRRGDAGRVVYHYRGHRLHGCWAPHPTPGHGTADGGRNRYLPPPGHTLLCPCGQPHEHRRNHRPVGAVRQAAGGAHYRWPCPRRHCDQHGHGGHVGIRCGGCGGQRDHTHPRNEEGGLQRTLLGGCRRRRRCNWPNHSAQHPPRHLRVYRRSLHRAVTAGRGYPRNIHGAVPHGLRVLHLEAKGVPQRASRQAWRSRSGNCSHHSPHGNARNHHWRYHRRRDDSYRGGSCRSGVRFRARVLLLPGDQTAPVPRDRRRVHPSRPPPS